MEPLLFKKKVFKTVFLTSPWALKEGLREIYTGDLPSKTDCDKL